MAVGESVKLPITVILITLNEENHLADVLENIGDWAEQILILDSFSADHTVDIALEHGVYVAQREFKGFGEHWEFALSNLPVTQPWVMKLDPDERLTDSLKNQIKQTILDNNCVNAISFRRQLMFMGKLLPVYQDVVRVWRRDTCRFTSVAVNEHPIIQGDVLPLNETLLHLDSPSLQHWVHKQNFYTSLEAECSPADSESLKPKLWSLDPLRRRMWIKKNFYKVPGRYFILFLYHYFIVGAYKAGYAGFIWAKLRVFVYQLVEYKGYENSLRGETTKPSFCVEHGEPHPQAIQL